jgi:hypothetical protein
MDFKCDPFFPLMTLAARPHTSTSTSDDAAHHPRFQVICAMSSLVVVASERRSMASGRSSPQAAQIAGSFLAPKKLASADRVANSKKVRPLNLDNYGKNDRNSL